MTPIDHSFTADLNILVGCALMALVTMGVFVLVSALSRAYLGQSREGSFAFSAFVTAVSVGASGYFAFQRGYPSASRMWSVILGVLLLLAIGLPFLVKIGGAWTGKSLTREEAASGAVGFQAWLSPRKLALVLLLALSVQAIWNDYFWMALGVGLLLLAAYPVSLALAGEGAFPRASRDLGAERERVLTLLEAGRITADESAELLNALAATLPAEERPRASGAERRMLVGAVLVGVSFFLPWFQVDPAKEMMRLMGGLQMTAPPLGVPAPASFQVSGGSVQNSQWPSGITPTIVVRGGDVPHGLGWLVLAAALGAAVFPFLAAGQDAGTRRLVPFLALGAGGFVLLYLIASGTSYLCYGIGLAVVGYLFELGCLLAPARKEESVPVSRAVPGQF